jgi:hypothetical protein
LSGRVWVVWVGSGTWQQPVLIVPFCGESGWFG